MNEKIVPNMNHIFEEFLERAARSCAYRADEFVRDELREERPSKKAIDEYLENGAPTYKIEQLASLLEERIRDVFWELFEIQRAEDASCGTDDALKHGLYGIQRALEQVERRLYKRGSVVDNREVEE